MSDYVAEALHDATLSQIVEEMNRRYDVVILGIMRADPAGDGKVMFTKCRRGNLIHQLGVVHTLKLEIEDDLHEVTEMDMDDGN